MYVEYVDPSWVMHTKPQSGLSAIKQLFWYGVVNSFKKYV